jgi:hypothetical protein
MGIGWRHEDADFELCHRNEKELLAAYEPQQCDSWRSSQIQQDPSAPLTILALLELECVEKWRVSLVMRQGSTIDQMQRPMGTGVVGYFLGGGRDGP